MAKVKQLLKTVTQLCIIYGITMLGNQIQQFFNIPLAGSIIGLLLFFILLQFKIVKVEWIKEGANFLLATMVFFFVPSVIGLMDVVSELNLNFIIFFTLVAVGTVLVAYSSGLVVEKMVTGRIFRKGQNPS
ncbi:CidA/LrgA family protein [Staphylococcus pseudintermedius]|nr:CidA/LrgA family protein [Staphylococcus pseudintermedius]